MSRSRAARTGWPGCAPAPRARPPRGRSSSEVSSFVCRAPISSGNGEAPPSAIASARSAPSAAKRSISRLSSSSITGSRPFIRRATSRAPNPVVSFHPASRKRAIASTIRTSVGV